MATPQRTKRRTERSDTLITEPKMRTENCQEMKDGVKVEGCAKRSFIFEGGNLSESRQIIGIPYRIRDGRDASSLDVEIS